MSRRALVVLALAALSACSSAGGVAPPEQSSLSPMSLVQLSSAVAAASPQSLEIGSFSYVDGAITVYYVDNNTAFSYAQFRPENGTEQGLAIDHNGLIYTTVNNGKICGTCVEVFTPQGRLTNTLLLPKSGTTTPGLQNVSVDHAGGVFVSDSAQDIVYYYPPNSTPDTVAHVAASNVPYLGSVYAAPDGQSFIVSCCGLTGVRAYRRDSTGTFVAQPPFSISSIPGSGAADDYDVLLNPTDPETNAVNAATLGKLVTFSTPHGISAGINSVAMNALGNLAYAADDRDNLVYVLARPSQWTSGTQPQVTATYKGFTHLGLIAVPQ